MKSRPAAISWNRFSAFPWHPILIALYVPLQLGAHNLGQIPLNYIYRSVLLSGLLALVLLMINRLLLRNWNAAGLMTSILLVLFFSYGQLYNFVQDLAIGGVLIGRHRFLVLVWLGIACLGLWWVLRKSSSYSSLTPTLNLISAFLVVMPVFQLGLFEVRSASLQSAEVTENEKPSSLQSIQKSGTTPDPDVYYIILDGYGRSDRLRDSLGFDNSRTIDELKKLGFFIGACSQSNYSKTDLSLSSSLNMEYVQDLNPALTPENTDRLPLWDLIKNNKVAATFKSLGYRTIAFETGFDFSHLNHLDDFLSPQRKGFNEFEILYLRSTMVRLLDDAGLLARYHYTPEDRKRELILFDLQQLEEMPSASGPKFVFAHLVIPHQPFVFGPDGEPFVIPERINKGTTYYTKKDYQLGYVNQAKFISARITQVVKSIIENSSVPPIIIIQGDHGPSHIDQTTRMGILNAYYFPEAKPNLYPSITPVNSFRLLFDTYFGADYKLLDDVSYYSEYPLAYDFTMIPNPCAAQP
jgi:hypothetical protein